MVQVHNSDSHDLKDYQIVKNIAERNRLRPKNPELQDGPEKNPKGDKKPRGSTFDDDNDKEGDAA